MKTTRKQREIFKYATQALFERNLNKFSLELVDNNNKSIELIVTNIETDYQNNVPILKVTAATHLEKDHIFKKSRVLYDGVFLTESKLDSEITTCNKDKMIIKHTLLYIFSQFNGCVR